MNYAIKRLAAAPDRWEYLTTKRNEYGRLLWSENPRDAWPISKHDYAEHLVAAHAPGGVIIRHPDSVQTLLAL